MWYPTVLGGVLWYPTVLGGVLWYPTVLGGYRCTIQSIPHLTHPQVGFIKNPQSCVIKVYPKSKMSMKSFKYLAPLEVFLSLLSSFHLFLPYKTLIADSPTLWYNRTR